MNESTRTATAKKQASRDGLMKRTVAAGMRARACVDAVRARAHTYTRIANYTNPFGSNSRYHDDNTGVNNIEKWQESISVSQFRLEG